MRLLVLGGTVFLGRHIAQAALQAGHRVTLFNRGRHGADLFPEAEKLLGDRGGDGGDNGPAELSALHGREFDAVIDTCAYRPEQLRSVVQALGSEPPWYLFVSSISACLGFPPHTPFDETAALAEGHEGYGPLKARCEEAVAAALPGRVAIVRPGLIVGPHDPTGRFTYWPQRIARGGDVLAPGRPERPVQWIDVRDLAAWCVRLAQERRTGVFHAIGPRLPMQQLLEACRSVARSDARFVWVGDQELLAAGFEPWTELPLWLPEDDAGHGGMLLGDNQRAVAAGLGFSPIEDTVRATLDWARIEGAERRLSVATLDAQKEADWLQTHRPER